MDRDLIRKNREYLNSVSDWIAPQDYRARRAGYGCLARVPALLGRSTGSARAWHDLERRERVP